MTSHSETGFRRTKTRFITFPSLGTRNTLRFAQDQATYLFFLRFASGFRMAFWALPDFLTALPLGFGGMMDYTMRIRHWTSRQLVPNPKWSRQQQLVTYIAVHIFAVSWWSNTAANEIAGFTVSESGCWDVTMAPPARVTSTKFCNFVDPPLNLVGCFILVRPISMQHGSMQISHPYKINHCFWNLLKLFNFDRSYNVYIAWEVVVSE